MSLIQAFRDYPTQVILTSQCAPVDPNWFTYVQQNEQHAYIHLQIPIPAEEKLTHPQLLSLLDTGHLFLQNDAYHLCISSAIQLDNNLASDLHTQGYHITRFTQEHAVVY